MTFLPYERKLAKCIALVMLAVFWIGVISTQDSVQMICLLLEVALIFILIYLCDRYRTERR